MRKSWEGEEIGVGGGEIVGRGGERRNSRERRKSRGGERRKKSRGKRWVGGVGDSGNEKWSTQIGEKRN